MAPDPVLRLSRRRTSIVGLHRQADPQRMRGELASASSAMRTGTRCTTLIQLPVAFCAGSSAKAAPVPPARPATVPWYSTAAA